MTTAAILTTIAPQSRLLLSRFAQVGCAAHDYMPRCPFTVNLFTGMLLKAIHFHRRLKVSIGQLWQSVIVSADTGKTFYVIIPLLYILIPDGPIYSVTVSGIGFKVHIPQAITLPPPHD